MDLQLAIDEWQATLGVARVVQGEAAAVRYGMDASGVSRCIPAALLIADGASLPAVMNTARAHRIPVYPISTGNNWGYGTSLPASDGCVILDLSEMKKIIHFDAELGVVTLEPGVTQRMLERFLEQGKHPFLVPVTGAGPTCSLVGNALERGYGVTPHVDHFGAVTDLEAVLADGSVYRTALREAAGDDLARLFKWGIGPYSAGLFAQSGFGIVTRMSIVLARRPECVKICLFSLKDDALLESAIDPVRQILGKLPGILGAINLMNQHRVLAMSIPFPASRLGPDGLIPAPLVKELGQQYQISPWTGFATLYGTKRMVAAAQKEIRQELAGIACRLMFFSPQQARLLSRVTQMIPGAMGRRLASTAATLAKSLELVAGRPNETAMPLAYWRNGRPPLGVLMNPSRDGCGLIWYAPLVPMRAAAIRAYVDMVCRVTREYGIEPLITFTSVSDRVFDSTVPLIFNRDQPEALAAATACYAALLEAGRLMGCFPYRVGISTMKTLHRLQDTAPIFHSRLRQAIDPDNLLAPGRYQ
ncbi:MAG: FAD-linked oxidase [Proteobacteria bacterium]|nr:FAD-linked oxidase [Pseudomonadota bacterium]